MCALDEDQNKISLTVPTGSFLKTGELSRASVLTVAPASPTTTYLFLEAFEAANRTVTREGAKQRMREGSAGGLEK